MKKLLFAATILVAGCAACSMLPGGSSATDTYKKFAEAWAKGQGTDALQYVEGDSARESVEQMSARNLMSPVGMETYHGSRATIKSETESAPGEVTIEAELLIFFDPPGAYSGVGGAMYVQFRHVVKLSKTGNGWKVISFEPTLLKMDERPRG
ncbi:MAG: hypothetical protein AB1714_24840 [Acidobacteriota bacterium]